MCNWFKQTKQDEGSSCDLRGWGEHITKKVIAIKITGIRVANGSGLATVVGDVRLSIYFIRKLSAASTRTCICWHTCTSLFNKNWRGHARIQMESKYLEHSHLSNVAVTKILLQFSCPLWLRPTARPRAGAAVRPRADAAVRRRAGASVRRHAGAAVRRRAGADDQSNLVLHPSPKSQWSDNCKNNTMWLPGWNKSIVALARR